MRYTTHLIDVHCHAHDDLKNERDFKLLFETINRVRIDKIVLMSIDCNDWCNVLNIKNKYKRRVICSFGIHPWYAHEVKDDWEKRLENMLEMYPKAIVGEIGIDKTHKIYINDEQRGCCEVNHDTGFEKKEDNNAKLVTFNVNNDRARVVNGKKNPIDTDKVSINNGRCTINNDGKEDKCEIKVDICIDKDGKVKCEIKVDLCIDKDKEKYKIYTSKNRSQYIQCKDTIAKQVEVFEKQLRLAVKYNRPVSVHSVKCWKVLLDSLKRVERLPNVICMHSFGGSLHTAKEIIKVCSGKKTKVYFSFSEYLNLSSKKKLSVMKILSLDCILIESDMDSPAFIRDCMYNVVKSAAKEMDLNIKEMSQIFITNSENFIKNR